MYDLLRRNWKYLQDRNEFLFFNFLAAVLSFPCMNISRKYPKYMHSRNSASYHMTTSSTTMMASATMDTKYTPLSRSSGHFSNVMAFLAARPAHADTPSVLYMALPTTVPTPRSDSVRKVPMTLTKSSGAHVAVAMNVAPATSGEMPKSAKCTYRTM